MRGSRGTIASGLSLDCKEGLIPNVTFPFRLEIPVLWLLTMRKRDTLLI